MKNILIITLIITLVIFLKIISAYHPDIIAIWSMSLDKDKRKLIIEYKIKKEIELKSFISKTDSSKNSTGIYEKNYDENGNQKSYKFYKDTLMNVPYYEEEYVTNEDGNIIEAYCKGKLIATQEFDDDGRITELINYDGYGNAEWKYEYGYDEEGNLTLELKYIYDKLTDTIECNAFEYISIGDKKLLKSKISLLPLSETLWESKLLYDYDSLGRETYYQEYGPKGKILQEKYLDYNSLTGYRKFYGLDGILEFIDSLKLNSDGKSIVITRYENTIITKRIYREYNESGKLILELELSPTGKKLLEWQYDKFGKEIEFKRSENEVVNYRNTFNYLNNGLPSETITIDSKKGEKETREFRYEYYE